MAAPRTTASKNKGKVEGREEVEEKFPSRPARELRKIKAATVPLADFTAVHPNQIIRGDKKMPPPVPVMPDKKPIQSPIKIAKAGITARLVLSPC